MPQAIANRVQKVFIEKHGQVPLLVRAPGRVNIIGEHTDYNEGYVLPAAIDKAVYMAVSLREDDDVHLTALDLDASFSIALSDLKPSGNGAWYDYILGVAAQYVKKAVPLQGFNVVFSSDVPMGAGLSSSAAVECATAFSLNELMHTGIDRLTLVQMAQKAEHEYAGVLCGIMDQFASMMGKKDHVMKLDCCTLQYEYVPFKLDGIKVLLLNTNVKHALASSAYNTRRKECETAVRWVKEHDAQVHALRDVTEGQLDAFVLPKDATIDKRSRYVVQEIGRLLGACHDLQQGDLRAMGQKMFATHDGLTEQYEVSCRELDLLVDLVRHHDDVIGARMMGGGFGGCTINLVKEEAIDALIAELKPAYEAKMGLPLTYYIASIENGTEII
ncbi:MAG TPA: galactokinase, partial [Phnomibacter sp.]|nr:galactokinase [Phnomibacter sp.]